MGFLDALFKPKPPAVSHTLKWPLPELRYTVPVDDAEAAVAQLKKMSARFVAGGTFTDSINAKDYGGGALGYFIVRTDDKTQNERLLFEGYMLQETEKAGVTLESGPQMAKALASMGYQQAFERHLTVWAYTYQLLPVKVYRVDDFGDFVEIAVPQTKIQTLRDSQDKKAKELAKKFAKTEQDVIPTDVISLQFSAVMDAQQQQGGAGQEGAQNQAQDNYPDDGEDGNPDNQPRGKGRGSLF